MTLGAANGKLTFQTDNLQAPLVSIDLQAEVRDEWKLDNGDRYGVHPDGYTQTGKITNRRRSTAHEGTYGLTNSRTTGDTASWTIGDLETGWYAVYSTWYASSSNSTTAQYDIISGDQSLRTVIDQSKSPDDLQGSEVPWELLTNTYVDNGTVTVTLTDTDDRKSVVTDAVRLQRIHQPRLGTSHDGSRIYPGTVIDFGQAVHGTPSDEIVQLTNESQMPLLVESLLEVPAGFEVVDFSAAYLAPSETLDLTLRQTASSVGNFEGNLVIATSDSQNPTTRFVLKGNVISDALVLDDRDSRFDKTGMIISLASSRRGWHNDTTRLAPTNRIQSSGFWVVENLAAGRYNVGVTWAPYSRVATNVPLTVTGGSQPETARFNQQLLPSEHVGYYHDRGSDWVDVVADYAYEDASQPFRVEISNEGINGKRMMIDAIRIERMDDSVGIPMGSVPGDAMMILNHNDALAEDTNLDGEVTALDALLVINNIARGFMLDDSSVSPNDEILLTDVNGDGSVTALDALAVLNHMGRVESAEGESIISALDQAILPPPPAGNRLLSQQGSTQGICLEERDWNSDERIPPFSEVPFSGADASISPALAPSPVDEVFGSDQAGRQASALAEDSLDDYFSDFEHDLIAEDK